MKTVTIAAAQAVEFLEDIEAALSCLADGAARAEAKEPRCCFMFSGRLPSLGCLTNETPARRSALDLTSPAFSHLIGLIEVEEG